MTECPICGAESEYPWRCSECGKLLEGDDESGRDVRTDGGDETAADETEQINVVIEYIPDQKSRASILADIREALHDEPAEPRSMLHTEGDQS
jgi:hypothetical protein